MSLDDILKLAIPNGWFLPVTPGTKFVTLGGAVANDVHGKNHHLRGTFGCHVRKFGLIRSDGSVLICSTEENTEYFAATIGGLGLTGVIDFVELQLVPVKSSLIDSTNIRFGSLTNFLRFPLNWMIRTNSPWRGSIAWQKANQLDGVFICWATARSRGPLL